MRSVNRAISALVVAGAALVVPLGSNVLTGSGAAGTTASPCHSSWLTPKMGRSSGAAGTTWYTLEIVNHSKFSCSLSGIPTARPGFFAYSMKPWQNVGPRASSATFAGRGGIVLLLPGKVASVDVGVSTAANYPSTKCAPRTIGGVKVTFLSPAPEALAKITPPPPVVLAYFLPKQAVCMKLASTSITGIALGTHFP